MLARTAQTVSGRRCVPHLGLHGMELVSMRRFACRMPVQLDRLSAEGWAMHRRTLGLASSIAHASACFRLLLLITYNLFPDFQDLRSWRRRGRVLLFGVIQNKESRDIQKQLQRQK